MRLRLKQIWTCFPKESKLDFPRSPKLAQSQRYLSTQTLHTSIFAIDDLGRLRSSPELSTRSLNDSRVNLASEEFILAEITGQSEKNLHQSESQENPPKRRKSACIIDTLEQSQPATGYGSTRMVNSCKESAISDNNNGTLRKLSVPTIAIDKLAS